MLSSLLPARILVLTLGEAGEPEREWGKTWAVALSGKEGHSGVFSACHGLVL